MRHEFEVQGSSCNCSSIPYQNRKRRNQREEKADITHTLFVPFLIHGEMSEGLIMICV